MSRRGTLAVAACVILFLARLDVATARRVVRGGGSAGGPAPQGYGKLDDTTFYTVLAFVGLGVVFCVLAALSRRGASRLAKLDAQLAAARGLRSVERGDCVGSDVGWDDDVQTDGPTRCASRLAVGDVVSLVRRGARVEGTGVVTRVSPDGERYHVRWSRELSDAFTYRPVQDGPLVRAKRRPGPRLGWRRDDLRVAATASGGASGEDSNRRQKTVTTREVSFCRDRSGMDANAPGTPPPNARALEGVWRGAWRLGGNRVRGSASTRANDFQLVLFLWEPRETSKDDRLETEDEKTHLVRLRTSPDADPAAFVTVNLTTNRLAMALGRGAVAQKNEFGFAECPDVVADGVLSVPPADEAVGVARDDAEATHAPASMRIRAGWLSKDGTFGTLFLTRVRGGGAEAGADADRSGASEEEVKKKKKNYPRGDALDRFRAAVRVVRTRGFVNTVRAAHFARLAVDDPEADL
jgi:hypothetical protein